MVDMQIAGIYPISIVPATITQSQYYAHCSEASTSLMARPRIEHHDVLMSTQSQPTDHSHADPCVHNYN